MALTCLRVDVVVETIETLEIIMAEVALVPLPVPCFLVSHVFDAGGAPRIPKNGPPRDQVLRVLGSHQPVHLISVDLDRVRTVTALDVVCDSCGVRVLQVAEGARDSAAAVGIRVEMLRSSS